MIALVKYLCRPIWNIFLERLTEYIIYYNSSPLYQRGSSIIHTCMLKCSVGLQPHCGSCGKV